MAGKVIIVRERSGPGWRIVAYAAAILAGGAALTGLGMLFARDQMTRHQSDLFSPQPLRRLAALGYLKTHPDVDNVLLLRDYLAWEERPLLRRRAEGVLHSMERRLEQAGNG